jgi:hypothetical protein
MVSRIGYIEPRLIADLQPGDILWDTQLKRFGARCRARAVTYFIKARIDGRQCWITLGRDGPLAPSGARERAQLMLAEIDSGRDPRRAQKGRSFCRRCARLSQQSSELFDGELSKPIVLPNELFVAGSMQRILGRCLSPEEHERSKIAYEVDAKLGKARLLARRLDVEISKPEDWGWAFVRLAESVCLGFQVISGADYLKQRPGALPGRRGGGASWFALVDEIEKRPKKETVPKACQRLSRNKHGAWKDVPAETLETRYYETKRAHQLAQDEWEAWIEDERAKLWGKSNLGP